MKTLTTKRKGVTAHGLCNEKEENQKEVNFLLSIDPGTSMKSPTLGVSVIDCNSRRPVHMTELNSSKDFYTLAQELFEIFQLFKCREVVCENFIYFYGSRNGSTITEMRHFIGFLQGYFFGNGIDCTRFTLYTSTVWKKGLKHNGLTGTEATKDYLRNLGYELSDSKKDSHPIDAFGIGLYHIERKSKI